jgi:hypothetical protein
MTQLNLNAPDPAPDPFEELKEESFPLLQTLGIATVLVGAITMGLYIGRELRLRYRFRRRTPSDFFSNAGDPVASADYEYGMGI